MDYEYEICISTDYGDLDDVPANFKVTEIPADASVGQERSANAVLMDVRPAVGVIWDRPSMVALVGRNTVQEIEDEAAEDWLQNVDADDDNDDDMDDLFDDEQDDEDEA